ncbi:Zinc finger with UFM1-specific peptidase domain protein [Cercospora beticola]|uniref:Zinc finger with UFM1-specific peptidase domain protein n=1 Tax=Cercospora beticola TaxID=122368 RepID=A0A2G5HM27_CERBT|nr:Zinc finger with UFM1-specific peptidase domain protein [Cercospora beticola]PIA93616.1 Zinc finger with UFM1-specific peptidase domain protein [Cercospora beticola]WPB01680.1 hypothetical protein RHO25_006310 [Cercospora beticola]
MAVAEHREVEIRRLGKRELGRHAFEDRMPDRIADLISKEGERNRVRNVIPKLAQHLQQDSDNGYAYLCTTGVVQVHKLKNEGGHFCGYRNIQMLLSCLPGLILSLGPSISLDKCSIFDIQEVIESAWDAGFNLHGRIATGGIRGSRKHIGTPEAEALMLSLHIPCTGHAFEGRDAWHELLDFVEKYFSQANDNSGSSIVCQTGLMPLFFQRSGHSMTIVGLQKTRSAKRSLLVFDPAWQAPSAILGPEDVNAQSRWKRHRTLKIYRKSERYLKRFSGFEILEIRVPGKLDA